MPEMISLKVRNLFAHVAMLNSQIILIGLYLKIKEVSVSTLKRNYFPLM